MPLYGQVVIGPPGSGKTTYCDGMQQYLRLLGRDAMVINFDPANETAPAGGGDDTDDGGSSTPKDDNDTKEKQSSDNDSDGNKLPYDTLYDVCTDAVCLSSVMLEKRLGPNGGLIYCMEYLEEHCDDIIGAIEKRLKAKGTSAYLVFDFPGQVELYTHSTCVQNLITRLSKKFDLRLTAVQLIDAHYCTDATKFLSASLLGTTTMLRLELPCVSVLSKIDLLSQYGQMPMELDFFTECHDLDRLLPFLDNLSSPAEGDAADDEFEDTINEIADDPEYQHARAKRRRSKFYTKFEKLHKSIAEVVEDFGLLSFVPLDISNAESVGRVLGRIDRANGYVFTQQEGSSVNENLFQCAMQADVAGASEFESLADVKEHIAASRSIHKRQEQLQHGGVGGR